MVRRYATQNYTKIELTIVDLSHDSTKQTSLMVFAAPSVDHSRPQSRLNQTNKLDGVRCSFGSNLKEKNW
jgi:hypothetical protein